MSAFLALALLGFCGFADALLPMLGGAPQETAQPSLYLVGLLQRIQVDRRGSMILDRLHLGRPSGGGDPCACAVCGADGKKYFSPCEAEKANTTVLYMAQIAPEDNSDWVTPELCLELVGAQCACPKEKLVVCGADGMEYLSGCAAACNGVAVKQVGNCADPPVICPIGTCPAPLLGQLPVCAPGGKTFATTCDAKCAGFPGPYKLGPCIPKICEAVAYVKDPICVLKSGAYRGITYQNPCYAMAAGFSAAKGDRYFKGNCSATCDTKCNLRLGTDLRKYKELGGQVCCDPGVEHISPCYAACLGGASMDVSTCSLGTCKGARAAYLLANTPCPADAAVLTCKSDVCTPTLNCPNKPGALCVDKVGCRKFFRFEYKTARCTYSILDAITGLSAPTCTIKPDEATIAISTTPAPATCSSLGASCFSAASLGPEYQNLTVPCCQGLTCQTCMPVNGVPCVGGTNGTCVKTTSTVVVNTADSTSSTSTPGPTSKVPPPVDAGTCSTLGQACFSAASLGPDWQYLNVPCCGGLFCQTCVSTADMPCVGGTNGTCVAVPPV